MKTLFKYFLLLLGVVIIAISCSKSSKIPYGEINILDNEWKNSSSIKITDSISLELIQNKENLFFTCYI
ncbi:MAG: hypothetical protein HWD85_04160 [Flavobacteriaceae bacterium]|nr:hypothetical protein [Flavobacteriaceae bacterium]